MIDEDSFKSRYEELLPQFIRIESCVTSILDGAVSGLNVDCLPVSHRVKTMESAFSKQKAKKYEDVFEDITDFVAFRIIVYLESDIDGIEECVRKLFFIDEKNSVDKMTSKKVNEFGYRSLHLICELGQERGNLQEYDDISEQKFEVQIRTVLQHAWAEIEHKKNYKGTNNLPEELERRLMTVAGTLELLDREFSAIAHEASEYGSLVQSNAASVSEDRLTSLAVNSAFEGFVYQVLNKKIEADYSSTRMKEGILKELVGFGIDTPSELQKLFDNRFARDLLIVDSRAQAGNVAGFLRSLMIIENVENYFKNGFSQQGFDAISSLTLDHIEQVTSDKGMRKRILKFVKVSDFWPED